MEYKEHPSKEDLLDYFSQRIRVRKMTEREAMRLMDVDEDAIDKIMYCPFDNKDKWNEVVGGIESRMSELCKQLDKLKVDKKVMGKAFTGADEMKAIRAELKQLRAELKQLRAEKRIIKDASISKTHIYALAGNSIVVNVIYLMLKNLLIGFEHESNGQPYQTTLF